MKVLTSLLLLFLLSNTSLAQRFDKVEIKTTQVSEQIYMLEGAGGNIAVFTGEDGVLMIDAQFAELSERILAAIKEISEHSITYLVNTHHHGDHTGGNENYNIEGATIIAQHNVRKRMSAPQTKRDGSPAADKPKASLPTITFKEGLNVHINGEAVEVTHIHNAHTDGDSFIFFPKANVLHMGDCLFNRRFPYIDMKSGGTVKGYRKAIETALTIVDDETTIIPGHGALATKKDLLDFLIMLDTVQGKVQTAMNRGIVLEKMDIDNLIEGYESWGEHFIDGPKFIGFIAQELAEDLE